MARFILVLLICIAGKQMHARGAATIRISGEVFNAVSGEKVGGVSVFGLAGDKRKLVCEGDENGHFSFELADAQSIVIEKSGYRPASAPVVLHRQESKAASFFVKFPLIPMDRQTLNSPYMQSEQQDFTLTETAPAGKPVTRMLHLSDALTGRRVDQATITLIYTKENRTEKRTLTPGSPAAFLRFAQPDIVGFTAEAPGYQTYSGNLIVDKLDGQSSDYAVALSPQVNLFSLYVSGGGAGTCSLVSSHGKEITLQKSAANAYCALLNEGTYNLKILRRNGALLHFEKIIVAKGLNLLEVARFERKEMPPAARNVFKAADEQPVIDTAGSDSYELTTIYFSQSEYLLKEAERGKLDTLAMHLRASARRKVRVVGHTDNVGDPKRNLVLSEYRARVIRSYLLSKHVPENQITFTWVGGKFPARKNDSEDNKKWNRRVELTLLPAI